MLTAYNSVLAQSALTQGALTDGAHVGAAVDCGLYGNDFRSIMFVINAQAVTDGTHTVTVTESPFVYLVTLGSQGSGTFTLTWSGLTTATIAYNAAATAVATALNSLNGFTFGVSGSAGGPYVVTPPSTGLGTSSALTGSGASLGTPGNFGITSGGLGTYTAVDSSRVQGTLPVITSVGGSTLWQFGVHHTQRYVKMVITTSGSTTGGLFSAIAVCDSSSHGPAARA